MHSHCPLWKVCPCAKSVHNGGAEWFFHYVPHIIIMCSLCSPLWGWTSSVFRNWGFLYICIGMIELTLSSSLIFHLSFMNCLVFMSHLNSRSLLEEFPCCRQLTLSNIWTHIIPCKSLKLVNLKFIKLIKTKPTQVSELKSLVLILKS